MKWIRYVSVLLMVGMFWAFQQCKETSQPIEDSPPPEPEAIVADTFFTITVNNLRIRSEPNLNGKEIGKLPKGIEVQYLHEKTDFTDNIQIGGKSRTEPWYHISLPEENIDGWVFGGGVEIKRQTEPIQLGSENLVYSIEEGITENLEEVFDIELPFPTSRYRGFYEYQLGIGGDRILDGSMRIETRALSLDSNIEVEVQIEGRYRYGKKDGAFLCRIYLPDGEGVATTYYEESQDNCMWSSFNGYQGEVYYQSREDQPSDCSFEYIIKASQYPIVLSTSN